MRKVSLLLVLFMLAACGGDKTPKIAAVMQKNDKYMNCTEVKLEMNEADFYKKTAENNKGFKAKNLLMPLGYVSTYMNADDALEAANSRVEYLQSISDILQCDRKERQQMLTSSPEENGYGAAPGQSYNMPVSGTVPDGYHMQGLAEHYTEERINEHPL